MARCTTCLARVSRRATFCPDCGHPRERSEGGSTSTVLIGTALGAAAVAGVVYSGALDPLFADETAEPEPVAAPASPVATPDVSADQPSAPSPSQPPTTSVTQAVPAVEDLAASVVRVVQLDQSGETCSWGSGSVIGDDGTILTNFHVVEHDLDAQQCGYSRIGVEVTADPDQAPRLRYLAEVYAFDPASDLAVLRVVEDVHGRAYDGALSPVEIGDSDLVSLGDELRVLGYPDIGNITITTTTGDVSGFVDAPDIEGRAWIKTDATIAGGSSGGTAVDAMGRLVAVPTVLGAGDTDSFVDCRRVQDTNGDGEIDESDTCLPLGGFINSLRPVNLARALIDEAAMAAEPIAIQDVAVQRPADAQPRISSLVFSDGITPEGEPRQEAVALPSHPERICAVFAYEGMADGVQWDAVWTVNGEVSEADSLLAQAWTQGEAGTTWVCTRSFTGDVQQGLWELAVYVEESDTAAVHESLYVGDEYAATSVSIVNDTEVTACVVQLSPSASPAWGLNDLPGRLPLPPGESIEIPVATALHDVRAEDCDGEALESVFGLDLAVNPVVHLASRT